MKAYAGYIYCITNLMNGRQYIGQTSMTIAKRYSAHLRCAKSGEPTTSLLYRAMRKYGTDNFSVGLVETVYADARNELKERLNKREIYHISAKNTYKPNGYNLTRGEDSSASCIVRPVYKVNSCGDVICRYDSITDAEKQNKLPLGSIKFALRRGTHYAGGYHWYDANDGQMTVGQNIGKQTTKTVPVYCFDMQGGFIERFESIVDASRKTKAEHTHISSACSGKRKSAGGYLWSYNKNPPEYHSTEKECRNKPVVQMDLHGNIINKFCSATCASRELGLQQSLISACCSGRRKTTGGYRWSYYL